MQIKFVPVVYQAQIFYFVYYGFHSRILQCFPASRMCLNFVNTKEAWLWLDDWVNAGMPVHPGK